MKNEEVSTAIMIWKFLLLLFFCQTIKAQERLNTREQWLDYMDRMVRPVLSNLASDQLKEVMPVVLSDQVDNPDQRLKVAYLEAFSRTLCGISPWLNIDGGTSREIALRDQYRKWAIQGITHAVDPGAKDYMLWSGYQPLVDASFFALALIRCPWIWEHLDEQVRANIRTSLEASRVTIPVYSNWILFSGMIEAFFCKYGFRSTGIQGMDYFPMVCTLPSTITTAMLFNPTWQIFL
jgi:hypothetical protein